MDEMRIFRDLEKPKRYVEPFTSPHARVTVDDQAIEAHAFSFLQRGMVSCRNAVDSRKLPTSLGGNQDTAVCILTFQPYQMRINSPS